MFIPAPFGLLIFLPPTQKDLVAQRCSCQQHLAELALQAVQWLISLGHIVKASRIVQWTTNPGVGCHRTHAPELG